MRKFTEPKLIVASHNQGKIREIGSLLAPFGIEVISVADLGFEEPDETEDSFVGNARIKAHSAAKATGLPALADDSGCAEKHESGRDGDETTEADFAKFIGGGSG